MDLRSLLAQLADRRALAVVHRPVDPEREMAAVMAALGDRPVLFERAAGTTYRVAANLVASRETVALGLGITGDRLLASLVEALREPRRPRTFSLARPPCQEAVEPAVDLDALPILTHGLRDAGAYVTAGVAVIDDPDTGPNLSFHRLLRLDRRRFAVRLVEGRGTHTAWTKTEGDLPVAICLGAPVQVLLAGAMSPAAGQDEMAIAEALAPTPVARCQTVPLLVPAECEIVLEGRLTHDLVDEGPFIDLTETYDIVRRQPVLEVDRVTHRAEPIYEALLPGGFEHKLLMGMPREPSIYDAVGEVCRVRDVHVTPGGTSWLHAVVQIEKRRRDDGRRAAEAAFRGHGSLKHVVVVDDDVDPFDSAQVEWAIATRVQADRDILIWPGLPGSSLDPSATHVPGRKAQTAKMGIDATIPWDTDHGPSDPCQFARVAYRPIDLHDYVGE